MEIPFLNVLWFVLLGTLLTGYAVLDGFDLGVGILQPIARDNQERRAFLKAIGPLWDGNEVWLLTFGGAMFAAFPEAYATIFSGFYVAFMLVIFALIFRAISIEFRGQVHSEFSRRVWDWAFFGSSLLATLVFGIAVGSAMIGVPLNQRGIFLGSFWEQLGFYPLLVGLMTVAMFMMHGATYLLVKTTGALQDHVRNWAWRSFGAFLILYLFTTIVTLVTVDRATQNFVNYPWAWAVVLLAIVAIALIPRALLHKKSLQAFLASGATIAALVTLFGIALFPNLVTSSPNPEHSLNIVNAASSQKTLGIMAIVALVGMPFAILYTAIAYWAFSGKVSLDDDDGHY